MLDSYVVTLPFGSAEPPYSESHRHAGIDLAPPDGGGTGDPCYWAADGKVCFSAPAGWGEHGIHVRVAHGGGWETWYSHLSRLDVTSGEVLAGGILGLIGATGLATAPHLHFQLMHNGQPVDPEEYWA